MTATDRLRLGILFGGQSAEHEVSIASAQGVMAALDQKHFRAIPIGVTKQGTWLTPQASKRALAAIKAKKLRSMEEPLGAGMLYGTKALTALRKLDVAFPLIHGTMGEDGSLQGFLELANIPYVGAGIAASAIGMDKTLQQAIFRDASLPTPASTTITALSWERNPSSLRHKVDQEINYPCFVKPVNGGSSVGVSKVHLGSELDEAMSGAFRYDRRVMVEEAIEGRQLEVALIGNDDIEASPVGEITFPGELYDYAAKYEDRRTRLVVPAKISTETSQKIRNIAIKAFKAIDCAGLARADFFVTSNERIYLNEINSLPGFTPKSMYPRLWERAGLPYEDLITKLVELALERQQEKRYCA